MSLTQKQLEYQRAWRKNHPDKTDRYYKGMKNNRSDLTPEYLEGFSEEYNPIGKLPQVKHTKEELNLMLSGFEIDEELTGVLTVMSEVNKKRQARLERVNRNLSKYWTQPAKHMNNL